MAKSADKMICPRCGVEMNHHCDKLVYGSGQQEAGPGDAVEGGAVTEFHSCPECGDGASRPRVELLRASPDFPQRAGT